MEIEDRSQSLLLPVPEDFPVIWEAHDDPSYLWERELVHCPIAMPMLSYAMVQYYVRGFNLAASADSQPIRWKTRRFNTYCYISKFPASESPSGLAGMEVDSLAKLEASIIDLAGLWEREMLPHVQRHIDFLERTSLETLSSSEIIDHLDATLECAERFWDLHFRTVDPELLAISQFDELCHELFDDETPFAAYRLLQGFDNLTLQANLGLWRLSRAALAVDNVRSVFTELEVCDVVPALRESLAGRAFLADLDRYLNDFGKRGDLPLSFEFSSWLEDPSPAIATLKQFIGQPERSLEDEWANLVREREQAVASARAQLAGYPQPIVERFEFLLSAAQDGMRIHEDHNYWIDLRAMYEVRRVLVECGRRLADAKVIARRYDLFHLAPEEIRASLVYLATPGSIHSDVSDRNPLVAERRAEMQRFQSIAPPMALGTPKRVVPNSPMARAVGKMFGQPIATSFEIGVLRGSPGSPGKARGTARLIRNITDGSRLRRGDVLVAETTMPTWTPFFATASAVVTDVGGVLSHCAVVAREFGIPAVVGVGVGTSTIEDGQMVEVDGDTGIVRIING